MIKTTQKVLPDGYTELEYIGSSGTQYIDLGIKGSDKTKAILDVRPYDISIGGQLIGDISDVSRAISANFGNATNYISRFGNKQEMGFFKDIVAGRQTVTVGNDGYYVNGTLVWKPNAGTFTTPRNMYLFASNGSTMLFNGEFYSAIVYEDEQLVRNLIPCSRNSDSSVGMYDLVSKTFFANAGTGEFTAGPEVTPREVRFIYTKRGGTMKNIDKIMTKHNGQMVKIFEQGFTREQESTTFPMTTTHETIGKDLKQYQIYGNSEQNGTPTPDAPIEIVSVGKLVTSGEHSGEYKIPVEVSNGTTTTTTDIYLDEPLRKIGDYTDYVDFNAGKVVRNIGKKVFNGTEAWVKYATTDTRNLYYADNAAQNVMLGIDSFLSYNTHFEVTNTTTRDLQARFQVSGGLILSNRYYICYTAKTTVNSFKSWLSSNNVEINYILASATEETVTLPAIPTPKGTAIFDFDTTLEPSKLKIIYRGK